MIKIENYEVVGWEHAIRGMRNPMNSWEKSDSEYKCPYKLPKDDHIPYCLDDFGHSCCNVNMCVGPNDHELMMKLANAGDDHGKVIRYLDVYVDITAPLYFWKEFRTYRKGRQFMDDGDEFTDPDALEMHIETNSCSTMHKIHEKEFTLDDFSCEHLSVISMNELINTIKILNKYRDLFVNWNKKDDNTKNALLTPVFNGVEYDKKDAWWQMIQLLPSSYNQKRTVKLNYQVLKNMYHARKNHKLDEWVEFCEWIEKPSSNSHSLSVKYTLILQSGIYDIFPPRPLLCRPVIPFSFAKL